MAKFLHSLSCILAYHFDGNDSFFRCWKCIGIMVMRRTQGKNHINAKWKGEGEAKSANGITRICVHIFSKFSIFEKILPRCFRGRGSWILHPFCLMKHLYQDIPRKCQLLAISIFCILSVFKSNSRILYFILIENMALRDPVILEFTRLLILKNWQLN